MVKRNPMGYYGGYGANDPNDFDPFADAVQDVMSQAIELSAPIQQQLRDDLAYKLQAHAGMPTEQLMNLPMDYGMISGQFPGGNAPTTVGEAQDLLYRSHIPGFVAMARSQYSRHGGDFFSAFSDVSTGFLEGLRTYDRSKNWQEPFYGIRAGYYGAKGYWRERQAQRTPPDLLGMDPVGEYIGGNREVMGEPHIADLMYHGYMPKGMGFGEEDYRLLDEQYRATQRYRLGRLLPGDARIPGRPSLQENFGEPMGYHLRIAAQEMGLIGPQAQFQEMLGWEQASGGIRPNAISRFRARHSNVSGAAYAQGADAVGRIKRWSPGNQISGLLPAGTPMGSVVVHQNYEWDFTEGAFGGLLPQGSTMSRSIIPYRQRWTGWARSNAVFAHNKPDQYADAYEGRYASDEDVWFQAKLGNQIAVDEYSRRSPRVGAPVGSEGMIRGENQWYLDEGARHYPPAGGIVEGQWREIPYTGSKAIVPYSGGGGRFGSLPPVDSFYDDFDPVGDPDDATRRYADPKIDALMNSLAGGRSALGSLRPGYGKTEAIAGAARARGAGVSLAMSPLTALNEQTVKELNTRQGIRAFLLPGHPGHGQDDTAWKQAHQDFWNAVGESIDPSTGQWKQGASSVVGVMSFEKFGSLDTSRGLGKGFARLHEQGHLKTITVDEAQEIGRGERLMAKFLAEKSTTAFPNTPNLVLGGTITKGGERVLQDLYGISDADVQRAEASLEHLDISSENVRRADYAAAGGRLAAGGTQLLYGYSTKLVDQMAGEATRAGRTSYRYHKGMGVHGMLSEEQLSEVQRVMESGVGEDVTISASSAAGLGLNIPGMRHVGQVGAARASDIFQRALRVRPARDPDTGRQDLGRKVGTFKMVADPQQFEDFANRSLTNMRAMTPGVLTNAYTTAFGGEIAKNWKLSAQEIQERLGASMERQTGLKGLKYAGGEAMRILSEAGLIEMSEHLDPETNQKYINWSPTAETGDLAGIMNQIRHGEYRSETDPNKKLSFRQFRTQLGESMAREYGALGGIVRQTQGLSPEKAGAHMKKGLMSWLRGGVEGLEQYTEELLPQNMAAEYTDTVGKAIESIKQVAATGGDMAKAMAEFDETVGKANASLKGSPMAAQMAGVGASGQAYMNALGAQGDPVRTFAARAWDRVSQSAFQAAQDFMGGGGDGRGTRDRGMGPRILGGGRGIGGLLYGAYLGSRFWRMFAEPSLQAMQDYGAMEAQMQPLQYFGDAQSLELTGAARMQSEYAITRMNMGRGAYEVFSPVMGGAYTAMQDPVAARLTAGMGVAAGATAGGYLAGSLGVSMLGMSAGAASVATGAGLVAGLGIGAYTLGRTAQMEWKRNVEFEEWKAEKGIKQIAMPATRGGRGAAHGIEMREALKEQFETEMGAGDATWMAQKLVEEGGFAADMAQDVAPLVAAMQTGSGQVMEYGGSMYTQAGELIKIAASEGVSSAGLYGAGQQYAASLGYLPGTQDMHRIAMEYGTMDVTERAEAEKEASIVNQYASQLAPYVGMSEGRRMVRRFDLRTQPAIGRATSMLSDYVTRYGRPMAPMTRVRGRGRIAYNVSDTASASQLLSAVQDLPVQGQAFVQQFAGQMADAGVVSSGGQYLQVAQAMADATSGFSGSDFNLAGAIVGGDMRAQSFASYNNPEVLSALGLPTGAQSRMYNQFGQPIYTTSGRDYMIWGKGLLGTGLTSAQGFAGLAGQRISVDTAQEWLGVSDPGLAQAFYDGGTRGAQIYGQRQSIANARAGIGIQMAQIAAQERFLWGGGQWTGTPAPGSMWYLQDKMRALQHSSQMAEFAYTTERMETANQFAIRQEDISGRRMEAGHAMQRWQKGFQWEGMQLSREWGREDFGFRAQGMALQRTWTRQDWAYDDQRRALEWEWGMEDINDAIRMSSGRERKQLVKQRERMGIMHGMDEEQLDKVRERQETMWKREEEQFDKQRERQETLWAREEEQFDKQTEYAETIMGLDQEQYELQVESRETLYEMDKENLERRIKDYEKQHELQEKIIQLQRDHQAEQLALSKAALGVQAQALQNQEDMLNVMEKTQPVWDDVENEMGMIAKYGKVTNVFYAFRTMAVATNGVSTSKINKIKELINSLK